MKISGGYFWKILVVDLSTGKTEAREFSEEFALKYIGGRGFGAKILFDLLKHHDFQLDPLSPENVIVISPGPLAGTYMPASGKTSFVSLSPATGIYGDSNMGGSFGVELRQAGYDALAILGRAEELSYLWVDNDKVKIVRAPELKGKTVLETEGLIRQKTQDTDLKIIAIGPAGENMVAFACITGDWGRNAGRCGIGAVMGSKNLKAIAVRGTKDLPVADIKRLLAKSNEGFAELASHPMFSFWQDQGLMSVIDYANKTGIIPAYNFKDGRFDRAEKINGYVMEDHYKIGNTACFACPMCCGNICLVKEGEYSGTAVEGPEYETAAVFGSNLGVDNFAFILKANQLCDELGIDTISTGNLIGAVIEGYQEGILDLDDTDGMVLGWGDEKAVIALINKIAARKGLGEIIGGGSRNLVRHFPKLAPFISQVKGLEQSAYDARSAMTMALGYATSDIGAHHTRAWPIAFELEAGKNWPPEKKVDLVIHHQTIRPLFDMLGVCRLAWIELGFPEEFYEHAYQAVTGNDFTLKQLLERSNRVYDLTRLIVTRLGISRKDDYPPERCFTQPVLSGPHAGKKLDRKAYDDMLDIYYQKRGWSKDGKISQEREKEFLDEQQLL
jgi:aldehyde:ferredoxin oxidoreductase